MNTSDSNEFIDPFGFVDDVDPEERAMRDREYDALVQAEQIEAGTGTIADLLASTDPCLETQTPAGEDPCCRWCGPDCDCIPPPSTGGSVAVMLAAMVSRPVDARTRTAVAVIDPMTLTGPAVRDYLSLTDKLLAADTALQHTAVLAVVAAATAEVDAHVAENPLTERGVKWGRADTDRIVREDLERTLNITAGDAEGRRETQVSAVEHVRIGEDTTTSPDNDTHQVQQDRSVRLEQARFDAAIDLLTSAFDAPWYTQGKGRRRTMVQLITTVPTLTGADEDLSELVGYGPVTAMTARRIAADADLFQDLQVHPTMGFLMDAGTLRHDPPSALRDFLTARRLTCAMPGASNAPSTPTWTTASNTAPTAPADPPPPGVLTPCAVFTTAPAPSASGNSARNTLMGP